MIQKRLKQFAQGFVLVVLCMLIVCSTMLVTRASGGFTEQDSVLKTWYGYQTNGNASESSTYPYSAKDKTGKKVNAKYVGFDLLYGTTRDLVQYTGEIPFAETHDPSSENAYAGFEALPYNDSLGVNWGLNGDISGIGNSKSYWGLDSADMPENNTLQDFEKINSGTTTKSLRLFALQNARKAGFNFGNIVYWICKGLAWLGSQVVTVVVMMKNINIHTIMDALKMDELSGTIYNLFVRNQETGALSPIAIICLVAFFISVVGFVIHWVRGTKKTKNLWTDIVMVALIGLLVLSIGRGHATALGSSIADLSSALVAGLFEDPEQQTKLDDGSIVEGMTWKTSTGNNELLPTDLMYTEISLVNKTYIDMQICTQFGVTSVKELDFTAFGSSTETDPLAREFLTKRINANADGTETTLTNNQLSSVIGNNLGYYYWFASSVYNNGTDYNKNIPDTGYYQSDKLAQMMTYLQARYNAGNSVQKEKIKNITTQLANPSALGGCVPMLMLTAVYVIMAIVLFKYALRVVLAKLYMLMAVLGIPIAGVLIASTNQKLLKTGKGIMGIFVMAFIRITVFSIMFDLILFIVASLLSTEPERMLIIIILLLAFLFIQPLVNQAIERALQSVERTIAPEARQLLADGKSFARRKMADARAHLADPRNGKIVGYDENGNPIRQSRKGGIFDTMLAVGMNATDESAVNKKSLFKIGREASVDRSRAANRAKARVQSSAEQQRENDRRAADQALNQAIQEERNEERAIMDETYDRETGLYNVDQLTDAEREANDQLLEAERELNHLTSDHHYAQLRRAEATQAEMSDADKVALERYRKQEAALANALEERRRRLRHDVESRIHDDTLERHHDRLQALIEQARVANEAAIEYNGMSTVDENGQAVYSKLLSAQDFEQRLKLDQMELTLQEGGELTDTLTVDQQAQAQQDYNDYLREHDRAGLSNHKFRHRKFEARENASLHAQNVQETIQRKKSRTGAPTTTRAAVPDVQQRRPVNVRLDTDTPATQPSTNTRKVQADYASVSPEVIAQRKSLGFYTSTDDIDHLHAGEHIELTDQHGQVESVDMLDVYQDAQYDTAQLAEMHQQNQQMITDMNYDRNAFNGMSVAATNKYLANKQAVSRGEIAVPKPASQPPRPASTTRSARPAQSKSSQRPAPQSKPAAQGSAPKTVRIEQPKPTVTTFSEIQQREATLSQHIGEATVARPDQDVNQRPVDNIPDLTPGEREPMRVEPSEFDPTVSYLINGIPKEVDTFDGVDPDLWLDKE